MPHGPLALSLFRRNFLNKICSLLLLLALVTAGTIYAAAPATTADTAPAAAREKQKTEPKLSQQEVEELFQSLKSILEFVSDETKYPIVHPVKHQVVSRDNIEDWLHERLRDEDVSEQVKNSELVLKKLGLLPREFNLSNFYVELLREQIAGMYNTKNKTMYLLNWMPLESQRPVMAHELTHALQDQTFHLDEWLKAGRKDDKDKKEAKDLDAGLEAIENDEEEVARHALAEGQGMAVMLDYMLAPSQRTILSSPVFVEGLKSGMLEGAGSPVFQGAPRYIKEVLAFPYKEGLSFVQELMLEGGKERAYLRAMRSPPRSTRQIMQPQTYLQNEQLPPVTLPKLNAILGKEYVRHDVGAFGEFDVDVFLREFAGDKSADKLSPQWRGGAYYALRKKALAGRDRQQLTTGDIALLYLSRWATPEAARSFGAAYSSTLLRRYRFAQSQPAEKGSNGDDAPTTRWTTDEGLVLVEQQGTTVLVLESFDAETTSKLRDAAFASQQQSQAVAAQ